jgi:DNA-binding response OmpR family regulator
MAGEVKVCECCGHPLPDIEVQLELTNHQSRIYVALQKAGKRGLTLDQLLEKVYRDDADGGPLTAKMSLQVARRRMQSRLAKFGLQITHTMGHGSYWRLETLLKTERQHGAETAHASA